MSARIQQIYIAMFGRPADPLGLAFWNTQTNNGANLAPIINALSGTPEYQARFAGQSNVQLVNSIYQSLFGRDADVAGLTFFVNALASGRQTLASIAVNILDGATGSDLARITNKVTAATNFTNAVDTTPEILAYGPGAVAAAQAFLTGVTDQASTIPTAAQTDAAVANIVTGNAGGGVGQTISLTPNIDAPGAASPAVNTQGSAGNDQFNGVLAATGSTLNAGDNISGGAGTDTLSITAVVTDALTSAGVIGSSIEVIKYGHTDAVAGTAHAVNVNLGNVTGVTRIETSGSSTFATLDTVTFSSVAAGTALQVGSSALNVSADFVAGATSGAADVATLILSGAAKGTITVGTGGTGFETVNISSITAANRVTALNMDTTLTKAVITGDQTVRIDGTNSTALKTIDASAATGNVNINLGANAADVTFTGGSGNDRVAFDATKFNSNDTVALGTGTDTLALGDADLSDATLLGAIKGTKVTGVEQLETTATGAVTISGNAGAAIQTFIVSGANPASDVTLTAWDDSDALVVTANRGNIAGWTPTLDTAGNVARLTLGDANATGVAIGTVAGGSYESLILNSLGAATNTTANATGVITIAANAAVTASGANALTVGGFANAVNFDGSALTGKLTVTGSGNADVLKGGTGADVITGANGIDVVTGGAGNDVFVLATAATNRDIITDFATAGDVIRTGSLAANNVAVTGGAVVGSQFVTVASSGNLTGAANQYVFAVTVENAAALSTDGASVLNALVTGAGSGTITTAANGDVLYFLVQSGTDVGVYRGDAAGNNDIAAGEIALVGVLQNTTLSSLAAGNFQFGA